MKPTDSITTLRDLRALVGTYLEGSDAAARATELLDALDTHLSPPALDQAQESREREMFGCTEASLNKALDGKDPRDIARYAMGVLSDAQEYVEMHASLHANRIRQLMNIAKYAIDKAVPR